MPRSLFVPLLLGVALVACQPTAPTQPGTPPGRLVVAAKLAPDTLVRSDGARCLVHPRDAFTQVEVGEPYPCAWTVTP